MLTHLLSSLVSTVKTSRCSTPSKHAFTHLAIPKDLTKSATSKEAVGVHNVAESSGSSISHSNSSINKTNIQILF